MISDVARRGSVCTSLHQTEDISNSSLEQDAHTTADVTTYPHIVVPDLPEPEEEAPDSPDLFEQDLETFPMGNTSPVVSQLPDPNSSTGSEEVEYWLEQPLTCVWKRQQST